MNIVLCGMPGAGKTTVGKALARLTGRTFFDTDELIEALHGKIAELFAMHGEAYFRTLEKETVRSLAGESNLVIATGGGLLLDEENLALLKRDGTVVFLRARPDTLFARLEGDTARPLLEGDTQARLAELMVARTPVYEGAADIIVDTDGLSVEALANKIANEVKV